MTATFHWFGFIESICLYMPVLTFDRILKIISTILSILSYAIALLNGDKVADEEKADA